MNIVPGQLIITDLLSLIVNMDGKRLQDLVNMNTMRS